MDVREFASFALPDGTGGNPAFVVNDDATTPEAAFIALASARAAEISVVRKERASTVRFYGPGGPIAFCGHGLLAAMASKRGAWCVEAGGMPVHGRTEVNECTRVWYDVPPGVASLLTNRSRLDDTERALGVRRGTLNPADVSIAGGVRSKLLVAIRSIDAYRSVVAQAHLVGDLCAATSTTGIYVIYKERADRIRARHFPIGVGFYEDPATGNGVLAVLSAMRNGLLDLQSPVRVDQGREMGRPCELHGSLHRQTARIGGIVKQTAAS